MLESINYTNINRREENQDRCVVRVFETLTGEKVTVSAVADGMGGEKDGAQHAEATIKGLLHYVSDVIYEAEEKLYETSDFSDVYTLLNEGFKATIDSAADMINDYVINSFSEQNGGSTLCACIFTDNTAFCINVGDSPIYYNSGERFVEVSVRDNRSEQLVREGSITRDSEFYNEYSSSLLSCMGFSDGFVGHTETISLTDGAVFLLGSDGAFGDMNGPETVQQAYEEYSDPEQFLYHIVNTAVEVTTDNQTVVITTYKANESAKKEKKRLLWQRKA